MPLKARQRSRLAVLAVLALVGSLLAVSAVPAVAAGDEKVTSPAEYSACVAAATEDAGFTDMAGNFAADEANCLAHYGITVGTSEGVFSPNDSISRAQMALFMVRAAGVAGVELDDPEDQGLDDIGNWTDAIQDGINQAVAAGIMSGQDNAFNPSGAVSRQDMAVILDNFLNVAEIDSLDKDGNVLDSAEDKVTVDTPFGDLGQVPFAAYNAINNLYELGVASGIGDGSTFAPSALVSRAQMAVFVTLALGHTNARPAGISMQTKSTGNAASPDGHDVMVSVRDADHQPVPDALVEVFASTMPDDAWNDDGTCKGNKNIYGSADDADAGDAGDCEIGDDDHATEPDGNATVSITLPAEPGTLTLWAWTGEVGDEFDIDEDTAVGGSVEVKLPAVGTELSDDLKEHATRLKFGDTITYTVQVVDDNGDPVAESGLGVSVEATIADTTGGANDNENGGDRLDTRTTVETHKTDASGRIEFSFTAEDPDTDSGTADRITLTLMVTPIAATADDTAVPVGDDGIDISEVEDVNGDASGIQIIWTDADPEATNLALSQAVSYHETNDDGVRNTVSATLVNQYGDPIRSQKVAFWSNAVNPAADDDNQDKLGLGGGTPGAAGSAESPADRRTTSRSGVATKSYTREATAAAAESIDAQFIRIEGDCEDALSTCNESAGGVGGDVVIEADAITHYWATRVDNEDAVVGDLLVVDKDNNTIVFGAQRLATYKAGDQFRIGLGAVTMEAFEKALSVADPTGTPPADAMSVTVGDDEDDINIFVITTNNN